MFFLCKLSDFHQINDNQTWLIVQLYFCRSEKFVFMSFHCRSRFLFGATISFKKSNLTLSFLTDFLQKIRHCFSTLKLEQQIPHKPKLTLQCKFHFPWNSMNKCLPRQCPSTHSKLLLLK